MKRVITPLMMALFLANFGYAQDRNDLKGPKAKNWKPWSSERTQVTVVTFEKQQLKGPEAKNTAINERPKSGQKPVSLNKKPRLKGPKAKNRKPWS